MRLGEGLFGPSTKTHTDPTRKLLSRPVLWRGPGAEDSDPIGPGLCGILQPNFREIRFPDVG